MWGALMVEKGLTNMQAIQSATGWAAECVGQEKNFGNVQAGKYADFLVVDGDPLLDIAVLRNKDRIKMVMKGGVAYVDNLPVAEPQPVGD